MRRLTFIPGHVGEQVEADASCTGAITGDSDAVRIAAERFDVLLYELECLLLVKQPPVSRTFLVLCAHEACNRFSAFSALSMEIYSAAVYPLL